jgi:hypothetical protein
MRHENEVPAAPPLQLLSDISHAGQKVGICQRTGNSITLWDSSHPAPKAVSKAREEGGPTWEPLQALNAFGWVRHGSMKELQKNSICLHASGSSLRFRPQAIPSLLFRYCINRNPDMSAENAFCNEPFKSFVVAWVVGGGVTRLIQDEESQGMFFTAFI